MKTITFATLDCSSIIFFCRYFLTLVLQIIRWQRLVATSRINILPHAISILSRTFCAENVHFYLGYQKNLGLTHLALKTHECSTCLSGMLKLWVWISSYPKYSMEMVNVWSYARIDSCTQFWYIRRKNKKNIGSQMGKPTKNKKKTSSISNLTLLAATTHFLNLLSQCLCHEIGQRPDLFFEWE